MGEIESSGTEAGHESYKIKKRSREKTNRGVSEEKKEEVETRPAASKSSRGGVRRYKTGAWKVGKGSGSPKMGP